jgi:ABC-2 type transport system ATP-binding protein
MARSNGIPVGRVDEVLGLVGLADAAARRVREYSLGMKQRLGIAGALLGEPGVLLFDEPVNGLDPDGVLWIRGLLRGLAAEGRTVLISSHLMSEMQLTADHLLVIGRGRLLADAPLGDVLADRGAGVVRVVCADAAELAEHLAIHGVLVEITDPLTLVVTGTAATVIGELAFAAGIPLHGLTEANASLEDAYMHLTADSIEHGSGVHGDLATTAEASR